MSRQRDNFDPEVTSKPEAIYVANGAHHIRFQRLDIGNTMSGTIQWSTNWRGSTFSSHLELLDSRIHHAGAAPGDSGHGGPGVNNGYGSTCSRMTTSWRATSSSTITGSPSTPTAAAYVFKNNLIHRNGTRGGPATAVNIGSSSFPGRQPGQPAL
jgi:hypothetical protein